MLTNAADGRPGDFVASLVGGDNDKRLCGMARLERSCDRARINRRSFAVEVSQTQRFYKGIGAVLQIEEALCHDATHQRPGSPDSFPISYNPGCGYKLHPSGNAHPASPLARRGKD